MSKSSKCHEHQVARSPVSSFGFRHSSFGFVKSGSWRASTTLMPCIGTMNRGGEIVARASRPRCRAHGRDARATTRRFMERRLGFQTKHAAMYRHWTECANLSSLQSRQSRTRTRMIWLRPCRAELYRGLPTRWPFEVPTPRRLAIGETAGWQPAIQRSAVKPQPICSNHG